ncbi:MAG: diacylglycerol kinase family lipid kinase [Actinobacteria bacterium]|nr:MAG: diacylglycerol kinase family lipid kinase [Actinomycetota bacterium]
MEGDPGAADHRGGPAPWRHPAHRGVGRDGRPHGAHLRAAPEDEAGDTHRLGEGAQNRGQGDRYVRSRRDDHPARLRRRCLRCAHGIEGRDRRGAASLRASGGARGPRAELAAAPLEAAGGAREGRLGFGRHVAPRWLEQVRGHAPGVATRSGRFAERRNGSLGRLRMSVAAPVVVIANPSAGRGKAGRRIGRIGEQLHRAGVDHEIRVSTSAEDLERRAREAADEGAKVVAVLGGDGSVGLAANGLLGSGAALAVLPSGTADDFAASIGVRKLDAAVRAIADANIVQIDVVRVDAGATRRHYVAIAGCGFDSEVNEAANAMRINLGATGTYVAALVRTLSRFTPAAFRIELDDEVIEGPHMLVIVGNSISYGGGMKVTPDASLVDGWLDVCLLREMSKGAFIRAFPKVFRGTHVSHPAVRMARATRVRVEADRRVMVYADGERVGPAPALFEILPGALPVVVGPNAKAVR